MLLGRFKSLIILTPFLLPNFALANAPKVGRAAAAKYFQQNGNDTKASRSVAAEDTLSADERFLTIGLSYYTKSESYDWGNGKEEGIGKGGVDMSYRLSSYNNLLDYSLRVLYTEYNPANQRANKISFLYAMTLPDAGSKFPLYFGAAAGPGVFFTQISGESSVTLDYQLYLGLRLFNMFDNTGFYVEGGLKNHLHLTSDGQLNGTYISAGAVFTF